MNDKNNKNDTKINNERIMMIIIIKIIIMIGEKLTNKIKTIRIENNRNKIFKKYKADYNECSLLQF